MRKRIILPLCLLMCLWTASAFAQGILPVLQTPMPEITQAVSLHSLLCESAPVPEAKNGALTYAYKDVTYRRYQLFSRALGQDGFTFESAEKAESGAVTAVAVRGWARVTVVYDPAARTMTVTYPPRVEAMETDPDQPPVVDGDAAGVLPEFPQAVSLESVSGWNVSKRESLKEGGFRSRYDEVSYDGYTMLSEALGREGYSLVSAETLEDGTSRAVVTDGAVSLTIDYHLENRTAIVTYPAGVVSEEANLFGDYTEITIGQAIPMAEGVTVTFLGWETTDNYQTYWRNTNWIPTKTGYDDHPAKEGEQQIWLEFQIDYNRPEETSLLGIMKNKAVYDRQLIVKIAYSGKRTGEHRLNSVTAGSLSGKDTGFVASAFTLRDSQIARLDDIRFTFSSMDCLHRYAVRLTEDNRKPAEEAQ